MRYFEFTLANDEKWHLITDMTLQEVKQHIASNDFITLKSHGFKRVGDWTHGIPNEADIQAKSIVYVVEDERFQQDVEESNVKKERRQKLIQEIEKYEFNRKMKIWHFFKVRPFIDHHADHPYEQLSESFLQKIAEKCKNYHCALKSDDICPIQQGVAWVEEILPLYHDRAKTTNKTLWIVEKFVAEDVVEASHLYSSGGKSTSKETKTMKKDRLVTQNGQPVLYDKKGRLKTYDPTFTKNGYKKDQIYHFEAMGFLGNNEYVYKVVLVTDQYVFFQTLDSGYQYINTYRELEEIAPILKGV